MIVIPAIDVMHDAVVRLRKGSFADVTVYPLRVVEQALLYAESGFDRIHIIDLLGSKMGAPQITENIKQIKQHASILVQCGGGLRTAEQVSMLLDAGADYCIIGSAAINNLPEFEKIVYTAGAEKIIIAADALNGMIAIEAWQQLSSVTLQQHIDNCNSTYALQTFLCTDISKDGMMSGANVSMYQQLQNAFPGLLFIASGGIACKQDVQDLNNAGLYATVVGKAIYEQKVTLEELKSFGS